ncbi:unnamed protein product [marine sediment metagenome]|uniref:Uncharacterized protein n=1 Tax=marine sediment metagenome TaxID=412755 RepID=X1K4C6_9ZZZZ
MNCGDSINDDSQVCSHECAKEYFEYVSDESIESNPEFQTLINGEFVKNKDLKI